VRDTQGVLDASAAAEAITKVINVLRLELSHAEKASQRKAGCHPDAPQVRVLNARIKSLKSQIADYTRQIAGGSDAAATAWRSARALSRQQVELTGASAICARFGELRERARRPGDADRLSGVLPPSDACRKVDLPAAWWEWSIVVFPALLIWMLLASLALVARDYMAK